MDDLDMDDATPGADSSTAEGSAPAAGVGLRQADRRVVVLVALAVLAAVIIVVQVARWGLGSPDHTTPLIRERAILDGTVESTLTGATVRLAGDPVMLEVEVEGAVLCRFEPFIHRSVVAQRGSDRWNVFVHVHNNESWVDVRIDRFAAIPGDPQCLE